MSLAGQTINNQCTQCHIQRLTGHIGQDAGNLSVNELAKDLNIIETTVAGSASIILSGRSSNQVGCNQEMFESC